jgi:hypothetical protein
MKSVVGKCPTAPGYGIVSMCVQGPTGRRFLSTPPAKMSSGPCPSSRAAMGAATNATTNRKTMKSPPAIATRSRLNRSQTCSQ